MDDLQIVSVPVHDHLIKMRDMRDFVEATTDAPEDANVVVLDDELQYCGLEP